MADLKERAEALCKKMPPEFQEWGVIKTRAYLKMMAIVKGKAQLTTIKRDRLASLLDRLTNSDKWTLEYCQALTQISDRAVDVSCEAPD